MADDPFFKANVRFRCWMTLESAQMFAPEGNSLLANTCGIAAGLAVYYGRRLMAMVQGQEGVGRVRWLDLAAHVGIMVLFALVESVKARLLC